MRAGTKLKMWTAAAVLGAISFPVVAHAQANPGGGGGGGGNNGGGGGGRNPGQWRQQMMDRLKDQLGATDDEFAAMQPKIEKVFTLQMSSRGGMGGRGGQGGRRGGGGGGGAPDANSPVSTATADLHTTLEDKDAKAEDIKAKVEALRAAKTKAKEELVKAQEDLKGVLTTRQEAVLIEYGMLD